MTLPMDDLDPKGLLPCPFCEGNAHLEPELYSDENPNEVIGPASVNCQNCGAAIWGDWSDDAIAAWNRRHLSATVPDGDGEPVGYIRPETLAKLREGDAGPIVGVAAFDTVIPLYAASRLCQGTGVTIERAFKDGVHYATIVDVPNTEEARDEAWRCSKVRALSGDTL